jgi:3-oxoadipate enol-lactonase
MPPLADERTFTTSDGVTIAFTLRAAPHADAPRIVLIHSLALDRSIWDGVVDTMKNDAAILTYDCRGHGRSACRAGTFTAALFARDAAELLDRVGWHDATVAGCSMGGCVALAFAGLYPERASRLGLIDTTAWYDPDAAANFRKRAAAAREAGMAGLADFQAARWFSDEFRARCPELVHRAIDVFLANDFECYAASCALLGDADLRPLLASFRIPVTIVVGEDDAATPVGMARHLHDAIAQSTLAILPGARHLTPIERPDRIASELLHLLRRASVLSQ